jgi:hypothetical protein
MPNPLLSKASSLIDPPFQIVDSRDLSGLEKGKDVSVYLVGTLVPKVTAPFQQDKLDLGIGQGVMCRLGHLQAKGVSLSP